MFLLASLLIVTGLAALVIKTIEHVVTPEDEETGRLLSMTPWFILLIVVLELTGFSLLILMVLTGG